MLKSLPFDVTLADNQSVVLPKAKIKAFTDTNQKRVKIIASFNDKRIEFFAALKQEKTGDFRIYFSKSKQKELGIFLNDYFTIQVFEDASKYGAEMPEALEAVLLSDYEAYTIFENFTPGKKRTIIYAIQRYKSAQTQVDKALLFTTNIKRGITDPKLWLKKL